MGNQPWHDEDNVRELYVEEGLSYDEICDRWGCSQSTLSKWVNRHGIDTVDYETGGPWTDEQTLRELYHGEGMSMSDLSDKLGCAESTLGDWMDKFGIERRQASRDITGPWQDREVLYEYYVERGWSINDIADEFGVDFQTVRRWLHEHDLPVRSRGGDIMPSTTYHAMERGYVRCVGEDGNYAYVHRLICVAEYGVEEVIGKHVHHKNEIPWDNRATNLEVLTPREHSQEHTND